MNDWSSQNSGRTIQSRNAPTGPQVSTTSPAASWSLIVSRPKTCLTSSRATVSSGLTRPACITASFPTCFIGGPFAQDLDLRLGLGLGLGAAGGKVRGDRAGEDDSQAENKIDASFHIDSPGLAG